VGDRAGRRGGLPARRRVPALAGRLALAAGRCPRRVYGGTSRRVPAPLVARPGGR